jgi:hypothetical protein
VNIRQLRGEAGAVLNRGSNRLNLILGIMISVSPLMLYSAIFSAFGALEPMLWDAGLGKVAPWILIALLYLLTQLVTLPLLHGLMGMAYRMENGEDVELTDVFRSFSSGRLYLKALLDTWLGLLFLAALIALEWGVSLFALYFFGDLAGGILLSVLLYIAVFLIWLFTLSGFFFLPYYQASEHYGASPRMAPYAPSVCKHYWLGFFPWLALSLLTFGILLLADLLPRMMIAYFRLSGKLNELTTRSEELINE